MCAPKVKIAFWRHIRDVTGNAPRLARFIDLGTSYGIIDGAHYHGDIRIVEYCREKRLVDVLYAGWIGADAVGYFRVQARCRAQDCYVGIGVEEV